MNRKSSMVIALFILTLSNSIFSASWEPIEKNSAPYIAAAATWTGDVTLIGGLPHSVMSSIVDNKLVVIGARTNTSLKFTGGIYDLSSNSWTTLPEHEIPKFGESVFNVSFASQGSRYFVWGGCASQYCKTLSNSGWTIDPFTNTWEELPTLNAPSPRQRHQLVMAGDKLLVWFGHQQKEKDLSPDIGVYDPTSKSWSKIDLTNGPKPRLGAAVWYSHDKLYVFGGHDGSYHIFSDAFMYDFATAKWTPFQVPNSLTPRYEATIAIKDEKVMLWGGVASHERFLTDGALFKTDNETWELIPSTKESKGPEVRIRAHATWIGDNVAIMGGHICKSSGTGLKCSVYSDAHIYSPMKGDWEPLPDIGFAPATANSNGNTLVIWGGIIGPSKSTNSGLILKP